MSATTNVFFTPLATALVWCIISSIVTDKVSSYPKQTIPNESPTKIPFIPDSSIIFAVE